MSDLYYRIIRTSDNESLLTVVCMQDHDEHDYDENRFLCKKFTRNRLSFSTEDEAIEFLNVNIKLENIHPEYRVQTQNYNDSFYKD